MKFIIKSFGRTNLLYTMVLFGCIGLFLCFLILHSHGGSGSTETGKLVQRMDSGPNNLLIENGNSSQLLASVREKMTKQSKLICDNSDRRANICELIGDVRIHENSSKIVLVSSSEISLFSESNKWKLRPYARKSDPAALGSVKEVTMEPLSDPGQAPNCSLYHKVPAIIFSVGGYTHNYYHTFVDVLIPLFITSHQFQGEVQFLISTYKSWWVDKFQVILKHLSNYEMIDADNDDRVHCFPSAIVGLRAHNEMRIDPSRTSDRLSLYDFVLFLRSSYSLKRDFAISMAKDSKKKPRLLIVARNRTRTFTNVEEIAEMAKGLGYEAIVAEGEPMMEISEIAHEVNSCDVMMGVHGAGLTNMLFLPTKAVLIQVMPLGEMEWIARSGFAEPSMDIKLRYLEYIIREEESTLKEQYPHDHPVLRDPISISDQGFGAFYSTYMEKQNVKLNVNRFKFTLLQALELLSQ